MPVHNFNFEESVKFQKINFSFTSLILMVKLVQRETLAGGGRWDRTGRGGVGEAGTKAGRGGKGEIEGETRGRGRRRSADTLIKTN
jgi:hypothetical protein